MWGITSGLMLILLWLLTVFGVILIIAALANGSDPAMTDYQGQTALETARAARQKELQKGEMKPERTEEYEQIFAMLE